MVGLTQSRDQPIRHDTGQSVSPSFEGWYPNPDGTFTLSFGYLNRNFEQTLDIPVGVNNHFEPGAADRGQPTHFLSRRQTGIFTVTVPANFGDQTLTWSLTAGNETVAIPGHLRPEWQIDSMHEITSDNRPPVVKFNPSDDVLATQLQGRWDSKCRSRFGYQTTASKNDPQTVRHFWESDGVNTVVLVLLNLTTECPT